VEGGERETDGELLAETDELTYECAPRQKNPVLLDEPIALFVILINLNIKNNNILK